METKQKPTVMVLADDMFVEGVKKGYYPEYNDEREIGKIDFITKNDALQLKERGEINVISNPNEGVYILNPFDQKYVELNKNEISTIDAKFIDAKAIAYKRAMLNMGAHCVILSEEVADISQTKVGVNVKGSGISPEGAPIKGGININNQRDSSVNLRTTIREYDPKNTPLSIEKVNEHLIERNLKQESYINDLFEIFCEGRLHGVKEIEMRFRAELKSALNVALGVDYGPIGIDMGVSYDSLTIHEFTKSLKVYFDDVPKEVVDFITKLQNNSRC